MALEYALGFDHLPITAPSTTFSDGKTPLFVELNKRIKLNNTVPYEIAEINLDGLKFRGIRQPSKTPFKIENVFGAGDEKLRTIGWRVSSNDFTGFTLSLAYHNNAQTLWTTLTTTQLGIPNGKGTQYFELVDTGITINGWFKEIYLYVNGIQLTLPGIRFTQANATNMNFTGADFVVSDVYQGVHPLTPEKATFLGSIRIDSILPSAISNSNNLIVSGSNRTPLEELNHFLDAGISYKDSYLLIDGKGVDSIIEFPAQTQNAIALLTEVATSRGSLSNAMISLTPITPSGESTGETFMPPYSTNRGAKYSYTNKTGAVVAADINKYKVKVKY